MNTIHMLLMPKCSISLRLSHLSICLLNTTTWMPHTHVRRNMSKIKILSQVGFLRSRASDRNSPVIYYIVTDLVIFRWFISGMLSGEREGNRRGLGKRPRWDQLWYHPVGNLWRANCALGWSPLEARRLAFYNHMSGFWLPRNGRLEDVTSQEL